MIWMVFMNISCQICRIVFGNDHQSKPQAQRHVHTGKHSVCHKRNNYIQKYLSSFMRKRCLILARNGILSKIRVHHSLWETCRSRGVCIDTDCTTVTESGKLYITLTFTHKIFPRSDITTMLKFLFSIF